MNLSHLITKAREAFNRADHVAAEKIIEQMNSMLNGRANQ